LALFGIYLTKYFRHQDTKTRGLIIININYLCLGAFVANLSGLTRLGISRQKDLIKKQGLPNE
jgi:hypothetical protein